MDVELPKQIELWPIDRLRPYARNPRKHSGADIQDLANGILATGRWTNPILVDEKDGILAGHKRLLAAQFMGLKKVPVIVVTGLTEDQKRAYVIADNQQTLKGDWDQNLLRDEIVALRDAGADLSWVGFSEEELLRLEEGLDLDGSEPGGEGDGGGDGEGEGGERGGKGLGSPVIQYTVIFEDETQQATWHEFMRWLRARYGGSDGDFTMAQLLVDHCNRTMDAEERRK